MTSVLDRMEETTATAPVDEAAQVPIEPEVEVRFIDLSPPASRSCG
jgi:hypothetical protein